MTKPKSGKWHWTKWWPRRWRGDAAVQACSLAARGAWREILDIMDLEGSGGFFLVGGEVPDSETIARLLGCTEREWKGLEAELERRKVFSRRASDGAIFCRSRVREEETEGSPEGHPVGDHSGIPRESEGSPPSRALSSSCLLSSSSKGSPEGKPPSGNSTFTDADEPPRSPPRSPTAPPSPFTQARNVWCRLFKERHGRTYAFREGKDGEVLRGILESLGGDLGDFTQRARKLLHATPKWIVDRGGDVDLHTLSICLNSIVTHGEVDANAIPESGIVPKREAARVS